MWPYTQDFNALSDGDLDTQDSWVKNSGSGSLLVSTNESVRFEGAKGVLTSGTSFEYSRSISNTTSGDFYFALKLISTDSPGDRFYFTFRRSSLLGTLIAFRVVGGVKKLQYHNGSGYVDLISPVELDKWYTVRFSYNVGSGGNGSYSIYIDDQLLAEDISFTNDVSAGLNLLECITDSGYTVGFDTFSAEPIGPVVSFALSGQVTLNGNPVEGATLICIKESDYSIVGTETTDESGLYAFSDLEEEETYHVAVEYEADSVKYNAKSLWAISPVEVE